MHGRHVRTGCVTCKCARAGYTCKGYAVPQTWLFEGATQGANSTSRGIEDASFQERDAISTLQQRFALCPAPLMAKALAYGNSDPFNSYAVLLGATENFYIQYYRSDILPQLYTIKHRKWTSTLVLTDWRICLTCLESEAAMYALLARISTIHNTTSQGLLSHPWSTVFHYQARAQAALRKQLVGLSKDTMPSEQTLLSCIWASCFLGSTELLLKTPNARSHLEATYKLIALYLQGPRLRLSDADLLFPVYTDLQRSCTTLSRPLFSIVTWFPWLRDAGTRFWHIPPGAYDTNVHPEVDDPVLRMMIIIKREGQYVHRDLEGKCLEGKNLDMVSFALHGKNLWFQEKVLTIGLNALEKLTTMHSAGFVNQKVHVQAWTAFAILLWGRFASQFHVGNHLLFDDAPVLIPKLRFLLLQQQFNEATIMSSELDKRSFGHVKFWALFVGTQVEENREHILGLKKLYGNWFLDNLLTHARAMGIVSWQTAVPLLKQFLYRDDLKPHISKWWV